MTVHLRDFQEEDLEYAFDQYGGRAIIAWSMGLGKSVLALAGITRYTTGPAVVICPSGLKEHWKREAEKHFGMRAEVLSGMTPKIKTLQGGRHLYVINYDIMRVSSQTKRTWNNVLLALKPEIVILDEGHMVKEPTSKRSKATKELCRSVPNVLFLSGTPALSRPIELWYPLQIIKPDLFPSRFMYGLRYCNGRKMPWGWDYSGKSNLKELNTILTGPDGCMVRRRTEDVLDQLPPKTRTTIPFDLAPADLNDYNQAVSEFIAWLAKRDRNKANRALFAEELAKIGYLKRLAAEYKLDQVIQWVDNFLQGTEEKLILFGIHKAMLRPILERFQDQAVLVDGTVTGELRHAAYDKFNTDPNCRLLIGNMIAAGVGWSCTSSSTVAFAELDWVPGNMIQAEERVRGIGRGTGRPINIYYLVANNTIELALCNVLQDKSDVLATLIDGEDRGELRTYDLVVKSLLESNRQVPKLKKART